MVSARGEDVLFVAAGEGGDSEIGGGEEGGKVGRVCPGIGGGEANYSDGAGGGGGGGGSHDEVGICDMG